MNRRWWPDAPDNPATRALRVVRDLFTGLGAAALLLALGIVAVWFLWDFGRGFLEGLGS